MGLPWTDERRQRRIAKLAKKREADPHLDERPCPYWPGYDLWVKLPFFVRCQWCRKGHRKTPDMGAIFNQDGESTSVKCRACARIAMRNYRRTTQETDPTWGTKLIYYAPKSDVPLAPSDPSVRVLPPMDERPSTRRRKVEPTTWRLVSWMTS